MFGQGLGVPARIYRAALADYDANPVDFAHYLGLEQLESVMGGKVLPVPRLEAWWGSRPYSFGGRTVIPRGVMPLDLLAVKHLVQDLTGERFDSCFANYYRDESDHISWHADDEHWIGPVIASVSLGTRRRFWLRRKGDHDMVVRGHMSHGDLLVMEAGCQQAWEHRVPQESGPRGPRLNLTFRQTKA